MTFSIPNKNWLMYLLKKPKMIFYYGHWLNSIKPGHSALEEQYPWLVYEAVDWLSRYLKPNMSVFEWGSGGSTLFLAKRVNFVYSIEHDSTWYLKVNSRITQCGLTNIKYQLILPKLFDLSDNIYASSDQRFLGYSFFDYARAIDEHPRNSFDLVIVDGRARPGCIKHAISSVKAGGYILLDNSEREEYFVGKQLLSGWHQIVFRGPGPYIDYFFETTLWQKPAV